MGRAEKRRDLRAALKSRRPNRAHFDIVTGDGDLQSLVAAWDEAVRHWHIAEQVHARQDSEESKAALDKQAAVVAKADAAVQEQFERLWFHAIPLPRYETLRLAHEQPDEDAEPGALWGFWPALMAACVEDSDLTEAEWAEELAEWPVADRSLLFETLMNLHKEPASKALLGKAFGAIR